ncbi:MAG: DUF2185 domain-containing protein [Lachnospiraceae bacterium]|nr:DUF2185 domain-containing protein [Lachnospiraceae bacterium]
MNKILSKIKEIMIDCVEKYLPDIALTDLEGDGAVFYMNGKNGTEFDWYVNDKLSNFMMFYDDKDNMGAVKATLYNDGGLLIYAYGDRGKTVIQEINTYLDVPDEDILSLAVVLRNEADDNRVWDENIEKLNTDLEPGADKIDEFVSNSHYYDDMRERKYLLGQVAYVSKKIMDEGWKIGYMCREEAVNENDSGWSFMVGDEDDEYINDYQNIQLMSINSVMQYDSAIWKYITSPVGTRLIRVSSEEFEIDENNKEIFKEKK